MVGLLSCCISIRQDLSPAHPKPTCCHLPIACTATPPPPCCCLHTPTWVESHTTSNMLSMVGMGVLGLYTREGSRQRRQGCQWVWKQQACGLAPHFGGAEEHHAACGGSDSLRKAQGTSRQRFAVQVGIVLVGTRGLFVAKHQCLLKRCQCVEPSVRDKCLGVGSSGTTTWLVKDFFHEESPSYSIGFPVVT